MDLLGESVVLYVWVITGLLYAVYRVYKFSAAVHFKCKGSLKVPDGRFWQLPFVGETLEFLASDPCDFVRRHTSKYGETFTTVLFGEPIIMTTSVEAASLAVGSPQSLEHFDTCYAYSLWGKDCMPLLDRSNSHRRAQLRKLFIQGPCAIDNIRKFCPNVSHVAMKSLRSPGWNKSGPVVAADELSDYLFQVCLKFILGTEEKDPKLERVHQWYKDVEKGEFVPRFWNLPGTAFHKAMKARKELCKFMEEVIEERRINAENNEREKDFLDALIEAEILDDVDKEHSTRKLSIPEIRDNAILALAAGHNTPALALTWVLKLLGTHPQALEEVQKEHDEIAQQLKLEGRTLLTYEDTRRMQSTWRVVQETFRMRASASMIPRRATKDLEFQGKLIPKGWRVLVFIRSFMMDPDLHADPATFNPSRFKDSIHPHSFQPFGGGPRLCPGMEYSRMGMLVFLHYFLTTRSWTLADAEEGTREWPIPMPAKGCPIVVYARTASKKLL